VSERCPVTKNASQPIDSESDNRVRLLEYQLNVFPLFVRPVLRITYSVVLRTSTEEYRGQLVTLSMLDICSPGQLVLTQMDRATLTWAGLLILSIYLTERPSSDKTFASGAQSLARTSSIPVISRQCSRTPIASLPQILGFTRRAPRPCAKFARHSLSTNVSEQMATTFEMPWMSTSLPGRKVR